MSFRLRTPKRDESACFSKLDAAEFAPDEGLESEDGGLDDKDP